MEFRLQQVVATGYTEVLISYRLPLPGPVWEVISTQKCLLVDRSEVTLGSVLLQGRLRACYLLAMAPPTGPPVPPLGSAPPLGGLHTWSAPVESLWAEHPFVARIGLEAAEPGLDLTLDSAHVEAQTLHPAEVDGQGRLLSLADQNILHLAVRLSRWVSAPGAEFGLGSARNQAAAPESVQPPAPPQSRAEPIAPPMQSRPTLSHFRFTGRRD